MLFICYSLLVLLIYLTSHSSTMVMSETERVAWWEQQNQIGLPTPTRLVMESERFAFPEDLGEFNEDQIKRLIASLRSRKVRELHLTIPGRMKRQLIEFPAYSEVKLIWTLKYVHHCNNVRRPIDAENIRWDPVVRTFRKLWEAIELKAKDKPDVPKITKQMNIMKWAQPIRDYLSKARGLFHAPLEYVIRQTRVQLPLPPLAPGRPYTETHGSIDGDLINLASHDHPWFQSDNEKVYYALEEATRGTSYATSLKPFQRTKDGRRAFFALFDQHASNDKWETELKNADDYLRNFKWKSNSNYTLSKFLDKHRECYSTMKQCAEHVDFQLPNERTRVRCLLEAIVTQDASLQAGIAAVRSEDKGLIDDFKKVATYLAKFDPVAKRKIGHGGDKLTYLASSADVSSTSASPKTSKGKTRVEFRYYQKNEFKKLNNAQKKELSEWRKRKRQEENEGSAASAKKVKIDESKNTKRTISSLVKAEFKKLSKKSEEDKEKEKMTEIVSSILSFPDMKKALKKANSNANVSAATATSAESTSGASPKLNHIIGKATHSKKKS